jgi:hypothetical protein
MDDGYKILRHLLELFSEKTNIDETVSLLVLTGVIIPLFLLCYAAISHSALFTPQKQLYKRLGMLQTLYVLLSVALLASAGGWIIYICVYSETVWIRPNNG